MLYFCPQEISFEKLWGAKSDPVSISFTLERTEGSSAPLACRMVAQQKGSSTHRQVIRINSDFPYAPVTASPAHLAPRTSTGKLAVHRICIKEKNIYFTMDTI